MKFLHITILLGGLIFGTAISGCDNNNNRSGPSLSDFREYVQTQVDPTDADCGDAPPFGELSEWNCCMASEITQGKTVRGTFLSDDNDNSGAASIIVRSDMAGSVIAFFEFETTFLDFDGDFQEITGGSILSAECPVWILDDNACNIDSTIALRCSELGEFKKVRG